MRLMRELPGVVNVRTLPAGPSGWWAYRDLLVCLLARNVKVGVGGVKRVSLLGTLLAQLNPVLVVGVYFWVGQGILKVPVEHYVAFVAVGHLHWSLFTRVVSQSCASVARHAGVLGSLRFPAVLLSLADVVQAVAEALITLALLLFLLPLLGVPYHGSLALYPLALALQVVMMAGLAAVFSALQVYWHDLGQVQALGLRLMFWFTPVLYSLEMVPAWARPLYHLNPMALFLGVYRDVLVYGRPGEWPAWGGLLAWTALAAGGGFWLFSRLEPHLPEELS